MTQQNAAMVEESTAASHALRGETAELRRRLAEFRIGDVGAAPGRAPTQAPSAAMKAAPTKANAPAPKRRPVVGFDGNAAVAIEDWQDF
jgi:methyl-accepting chemotaxis protein